MLGFESGWPGISRFVAKLFRIPECFTLTYSAYDKTSWGLSAELMTKPKFLYLGPLVVGRCRSNSLTVKIPILVARAIKRKALNILSAVILPHRTQRMVLGSLPSAKSNRIYALAMIDSVHDLLLTRSACAKKVTFQLPPIELIRTQRPPDSFGPF